MKVVRGEIHDYLGVIMDFTQEVAFKIDINNYIGGIFEEFPYNIKATKMTPCTKKSLKFQ